MQISSRNMKSAMTRLTAQVQKVRDELEQLLDDDDDMVDTLEWRIRYSINTNISS
ncbi:hypothetical protein CY35_04G092600 [Sphagnum magellanicum]|nr:hypothetical protein CY35_04G092600 [Sphagnum magellanicum]